jgi:Caspase domain
MNNIKYFSSFGGYDEPPVPQGEIAFADTATVPTFYLGWFGDSGYLTRFQKIAVTKREIRRFTLTEWTQPQSKVYFTVEDLSDKPIGWNPVKYDATECLSEYYEGQVDHTGLGGEAAHLERLIAFTQNYDSNSPALQLGHAILIATEENADPHLPAISSARNETNRIAGVLTYSKFAKFESITTLMNCRTSDIRNQIRTSVGSVRNNEILLLYFSGHSLVSEDGDVLLSTGDTVLEDMHKSSISMRMLTEQFANCQGKVLLILDCCHSGSSSEVEERRAIDTFSEIQRSDNIAVVASRRLVGNSTNALCGPLVRGLLGHADINRDGIVGEDELMSFMNQSLQRAPDFHWFVGYGTKRFSDFLPKYDKTKD